MIYIIGNIALALQHWFPALLVLRAVQSCGSSGTVALASAVAADIITSAERGAYMGFASLGNILAPSLGPIAGGLLSQYLGWQAIFWFLAIISGIFFVPLLLFFPETCRTIVGDGSIPPHGWNRTLRHYLQTSRSRESEDDVPQFHHSSAKPLTIPNPWSSLQLLFRRPVGLILLSNGVVFGSYYAVTAGIPAQFGALYGLNDLAIGLCFIPAGLGSLLSATANGLFVDWNYRRTRVQAGQSVHHNQKDDMLAFPIERARLQIGLPMTVSAGHKEHPYLIDLSNLTSVIDFCDRLYCRVRDIDRSGNTSLGGSSDDLSRVLLYHRCVQRHERADRGPVLHNPCHCHGGQ